MGKTTYICAGSYDEQSASAYMRENNTVGKVRGEKYRKLSTKCLLERKYAKRQGGPCGIRAELGGLANFPLELLPNIYAPHFHNNLSNTYEFIILLLQSYGLLSAYHQHNSSKLSVVPKDGAKSATL